MSGHDVIHLRGLEFYAFHGVMPEEQVLGQRFIIDMDLFFNMGKACASDRVEDTIHYGEVYQAIQACVIEEKYQLLEFLAEKIAQSILAQFSCLSVRVEVHKPQAPIPGIFKDVSVEIWRDAGVKS